MTKVLRSERIRVEYHPALSRVCHQAKNLYNRANFLIKTSLHQSNRLLFYNELDKQLKQEECYRELPAHVAQQTLKRLSRDWKSYFRAKQEWKKHPQRFLAQPNEPHYKKKDGETVVIFTNQQAKIRNGWLILPKKVNYTYKTRLTAQVDLREVRVIPQRTFYTFEVVYSKNIPNLKKKLIRKGAVDLGMDNLAAFVDNLGGRPIVIKDVGKGIKSITQYYLKEQKKQLQNQKNLKYGPAYYNLKAKWKRKLYDALHKLTKYLVDLWVERDLHEVIIGYNKLWKQGLHFWKKTTQMFVNIPFQRIIDLLIYKGEERGITVETIPEEFTSKCSFLDNEFPRFRKKYKGKRVYRGLFRTAQGHLINADVNAAYNILKKSDPKALPKVSANGVGGYVMYPQRVSIEELPSVS